MISDVFYEAHEDAREYLDCEWTPYTGDIRSRVEKCLEEMKAIQLFLDAPPVLEEKTA